MSTKKERELIEKLKGNDKETPLQKVIKEITSEDYAADLKGCIMEIGLSFFRSEMYREHLNDTGRENYNFNFQKTIELLDAVAIEYHTKK